MGPSARLLADGRRLHLQHGPIDLIVDAAGERHIAFEAAISRFASVLDELVAELPRLRLELQRDQPRFTGETARRMGDAVRPFANNHFVTPMAAVAGSVAETVLKAMTGAAELKKAYVNNGGDIAIHLTEGQSFSMAMASHDGKDLGRINIEFRDPVRGIATSARHGRSLSMGIADSVTVLAPGAAVADVAATLIANAVDLPCHDAISRTPASTLDENSDLNNRRVVTHCAHLSVEDCQKALEAGNTRATRFANRGLISGAALFLQDKSLVTGPASFKLHQRTRAYA